MRDPRLLVRVVSGLIFLGFGAAKFLNHGAEVDSFDTYGLPSPSAFVYAIGTIEIAGGLMLLLGRGVGLAALVLAGDMVGAIFVSGIKEGEAISLTLAPLLLIGMVYLLSSARRGYSRAP
jgi:putative oxidoreductase